MNPSESKPKRPRDIIDELEDFCGLKGSLAEVSPERNQSGDCSRKGQPTRLLGLGVQHGVGEDFHLRIVERKECLVMERRGKDQRFETREFSSRITVAEELP